MSTPSTSTDRMSTRLNSSHLVISYAVFCLKKYRMGDWRVCTPSRSSSTQRIQHWPGAAAPPVLLVAAVKLHLPQSAGHGFRLFFFNDTATTEIYTLSLHDALPI